MLRDAAPQVQAPPHPKPIVWGFTENLYRDAPTIDRKLAVMKQMGATMVRLDLDITPIQAHAVRQARADGLRVMGVVSGGSRQPERYAARIERIVRHFAPMGVHFYEIWNEPNLVQFWPTADDPDRATTEYMAMVEAAYPRIKAADPEASCSWGPSRAASTWAGAPTIGSRPCTRRA